MKIIPPLVNDLAGGLNVNWSHITPNEPQREKLATVLCLRAIFRVSLVALAAFATFKLALTPFLVIPAIWLLSVPSAILFTATLLTKGALMAAQAAFITKSALVITTIFGSVIIHSLAAKALLATGSSLLAYGFFHLSNQQRGLGFLDLRVTKYLIDSCGIIIPSRSEDS